MTMANKGMKAIELEWDYLGFTKIDLYENLKNNLKASVEYFRGCPKSQC